MVYIGDLQFEDGGKATSAMQLTNYSDIVAQEQALETELAAIRAELATEQEDPVSDTLVELQCNCEYR